MSLNDFVVDALIHTPSYKSARLWTVENHEKYSTLMSPAPRLGERHHFNHEIFLLMCDLNAQGVRQHGLCADTRGRRGLNSVIDTVAEKLAALSWGHRVHYVELGPEPVKTARLLKRIAETATSIRYTAIDINQTSESAMRDAVLPILSEHGDFNYVAADYRTVTHAALRHDQDLTLITLLGFQEGNELPVSTGRLIRSLAGDTTYILSEMQVYEDGLEDAICTFYANPSMLKFSRMVALQQGFTPSGEHKTTLVPLQMLDEQFHVAATLQPVQRLQQQGYLLSNVCLKYTPEQFRHIRTRHCNCNCNCNCNVVDEFATGDGSVRFQLAKYLQ